MPCSVSLSYERQSQSELTDHSPDLLNPMAQPECAGALLLFPGCLDHALSQLWTAEGASQCYEVRASPFSSNQEQLGQRLLLEAREGGAG